MSPYYNMFVITLFMLIAAHGLADFPLQGDYMAKAKDPAFWNGRKSWMWVMYFHSTIHAAAVYLITGSLWLAVIEQTVHGATDYAKCKNWISFDVDQAIHVGCKVIYAGVFAYAHYLASNPP